MICGPSPGLSCTIIIFNLEVVSYFARCKEE